MRRCRRACPYVSDDGVHLGLTLRESHSKLAFDKFYLCTRIRTGADCVSVYRVYRVPRRVWRVKERNEAVLQAAGPQPRANGR